MNEEHGWAAGSGGFFYHTSNGGRTWADQSSYLTTDPSLRVKFSAFTFDWYDVTTFSTPGINLVAIVGMGGHILQSRDYGQTWLASPTVLTNTLKALQFLDEGWAWAVGDAGYMLATSNGGLSWQRKQAAGIAQVDLLGVEFITRSTGYIIGKGGALFYTDDMGGTGRAPTGILLLAFDQNNKKQINGDCSQTWRLRAEG
eukprot:509587-Prorocentrum_minimum.AAC.3